MTAASAGDRFLELHRRRGGFIMPNAWDPGSAILLAEAGFEAIGTTSAGIAFSMGRQDYGVTDAGLAVPREVMFERMREIAAAVPVPVNGDLEAGYGDAPEKVAETVRLAIEAGLAGGNIEDKRPLHPGLYDEGLAAERIAAAREAATASGRAFVLTARTDAFQVSADGLAAAVRRANLYRQAGADCLFAPGPTDPETVSTLVREIEGPLNVVLGLDGAAANAQVLLGLGVQRISLGGTIARSVMGFIRQCARELRDGGTIGFAEGQISGGELNRLFARALSA